MKKNTLSMLSLLFCSTLVMAQNWTVGGNNLSATGRLGSNNNNAIVFETNNKERGKLTGSGLWGFGISSPGAKVHINSAAGQEALLVDANGLRQLYVPAAGGLAIGGGNVAPTSNGLYVTGNTGLGSTPGAFKLKVTHSTFGFNIENSSSLDDWEFWSNAGGLSMYCNGNYRGNFNPATGTYSSVSDQRLKTNMQAMPSMLDKIRQLKPLQYEMKQQPNITYYGFVAQEVKEVFPQLVMHTVNKERNLDVYTLDYSGFAVIAIKAIQEMQQTISSLESRLAKLEAAQTVISKK